MLKALASLEAEHGCNEGLFYVWAIVDRAYVLSPEMQTRYHTEQSAGERRTAVIREKAAACNDRADLNLSLTRTLHRGPPSPRTRRTSPFWITEGDFNPSRALVSLARRRLIIRRAVKGGRSAGLTDIGREIAALLSVGANWNRISEPLEGAAVEIPDA